MKSQKPLRVFYLKCLALSLPFFLLIGIYCYEDPFMIIRSYDDYDHSHVELSEGDIGWKKIKMFRKQRQYDSFIMGASCTKAYNCGDWNRYINARPFRFFGNSEGLGDVCLKLQALDKLPGQQVKNLLIVTERSFYEKAHPQPGVMHIMPPDVTGKSFFSYQAAYLQGFLFPKFLLPYLKFKFTNHYDKSMANVIEDESRSRARYTNDAALEQEDDIRRMGEGYWRQPHWRKALAKPQTVHPHDPVIGPEQLARLTEIRDFCRRHNTRLKLIVGPTFELEQLNSRDLKALRTIFGDSVVYDFSANLPLHDYHGFYDPIHYRRCVGQKILQQVYK